MVAEVTKPDFSYVWASGGAIVAPSNVKIQTGWTAEVPPFQWENSLQNRQDNAIVHLFQKGISEWDTLSNYYFTTSGTRSYVQGSDGQVYVAVADSLNQNPVTDATHTYWKPAFAEQAGHGRCRLSVTSTTTLSLKPYDGNGVNVNGIALLIPAAGVTYTASGLTASTVYYVYLSGTTAAPVLSLSATGHSQASNGIETKTGDTTQTLVGMVYTNASTQFIDSAAIRTCLNWFNRRKIVSDASQAGPFSFSSTTLSETSSTLRAQFLKWADDTPIAQVSGNVTQTSGTPSITSLSHQIYMDGTTAYGPGLATVIQPTWNMTVAAHGALGGLSEGYHYSTLFSGLGPNGGTLAISNTQNSVSIFG